MNKFNYKEKYTVWVPELEPNKNYDPINVLGMVSWLWMNSQLHSNWSVKMLSINVLPAIENNQFSILFQNDIPYAFCTWAFFSDTVELKYIQDSNSLQKDDWKSGENIWFIDGLSPFGGIKHLTYFLRNISLFRSKIGYIKNVRAHNLDNAYIRKVIGKNVQQELIKLENLRFMKNISKIIK